MFIGAMGRHRALGLEGTVSIGESITREREAKGLSVAQLADKIGVSVPILSRLERGLQVLTAERALDIARALKISVDTLLS